MSHPNPFSTRFVRPGAIPYQPTPGQHLKDLIRRFAKIGRLGQIVGPHGSGKSTLLADLVRLWEAQGEQVLVFELHDGQRRLPLRLASLHRESPPTLIAADGYEQLSPSAQRNLRRFCRRYEIGLVITSHRSMGIPDLVRCTPSLAGVAQLVRQLLTTENGPITDEDIRRSFHRHEGNVREVLFEMYDLYESNT